MPGADAKVSSIARSGADTVVLTARGYMDMKEDNVIKPFVRVDGEQTHRFRLKFVNFEELFQLLTRVHRLVRDDDKQDITDYATEYIRSRLATLQPHAGLFKRVDEEVLTDCEATQIHPLMEIACRCVVTQYTIHFIVRAGRLTRSRTSRTRSSSRRSRSRTASRSSAGAT